MPSGCETFETYCKTYLIAQQIAGRSTSFRRKIDELLLVKRRMGLPDARMAGHLEHKVA